ITYFVLFLGLCFVLGALGVAYNTFSYYRVVDLVLASVAECRWLLSLGVSFVSLVLFIVYLGCMLVIFVYSVSLVAELF
ncbi:NU6M oxidoreductase, partial [Anseranas semipalmata]|nr:NU6M oxidoreductase [Anseranas semipalmata]